MYERKRKMQNNWAEQLKTEFADSTSRALNADAGREAAILIPLVEVNGEPVLLFEKRAASLRRQPGEICFPGGRMEAGETPVEAAVRETCEELLISRDQIEVIREIGFESGPGGNTVWVVLGILHEYQGTYSSDEVEEIFTVPLAWLEEHEPDKYTAWMKIVPDEDFPYEQIPGGRDYAWTPRKHEIYFYRYQGHVIWGFTAHVVVDFLQEHKFQKK